MNYHFEKNTGTLMKHTIAAAYAGVWSVESRAMLPLSRTRLQTFPLSVFMFADNKYKPPVGHIGISQFEAGHAVVGGFVVDPNSRGQGYGQAMLENLLGNVTQEIPDIAKLTSNVNQPSVDLFLRAGGVVLGEREDPSPTGCNTVIDLTPALALSTQGVEPHES